MARLYCSAVIALILSLESGSSSWAQNAAAVLPHGSGNKHKPTLAIAVSPQKGEEQNRDNLEDLLMVELSQQSFLQLVERKSFPAMLKEHVVSLSNSNGTENALVPGEFVGADYLLHFLVEDRTATLRLVEAAGGRLKLEEQVLLTDDLTLSAVAIREKILAALHPESQAANRLTVGIAAFVNRSGTERSDKLGVDLQHALRKRLKNETWAVVLERQYPTSLLDEVDLARTGLVCDGGAEVLPPADLVIFGSMEDADGDYSPGKSWSVKLDLTLRLRGKSRQIAETFRSDAVETVADLVVEQINNFRRRPTSSVAVSEKELWRRQALYLMPPRCETWRSAIVPNFYSSSEVTKREAIRAWENVLLFDADDPEAMTYLGVCMVGFNRSSDETSTAQCISGSRLVERAFRSHPNEVRADTFISCLPFLRGMSSVRAKQRAKEMAQYVYDHPEQFKYASDYWVKEALNTPVPEEGNNSIALHAVWKRAIENCEKDPESVLLVFSQAYGGPKYPLEQAAAFLEKQHTSSDPVVRFVAHRNIGELLCRKKDTAGLLHFDRAIALLEEAYSRCSNYSMFFDNVYQLRIEACQSLEKPEEAKETTLAGTRHFMKNRRYNLSVAWLYHHCATEVLGDGQEKESLAICDAFLAGFKQKYWEGRDLYPTIAAKREYLMVRLAGKSVPDSAALRHVKGTAGNDLKLFRMTAAKGNIWLVSGTWSMGGTALLYRQNADKVEILQGIPKEMSCVATTNDAVYFGGAKGVYKLDGNGKLLRHYDRKHAAIPGDQIMDVCEGGGKIYFIFQGSPHLGVAVLDPATDNISVLASSNREVQQEPINSVFRISWDNVTPRLHAYCYTYWHEYNPTLIREYGWTPLDKKWQEYPIEESALRVVSDGDETITVKVRGDRSEFSFVKAGKKVLSDVPLPSLMGEPAWDDRRIWVPTSSGLYEVDRNSGRVSWLAYQEGNPFFSVLKHGNRLYVATARGLFYRDIESTTENDQMHDRP